MKYRKIAKVDEATQFDPANGIIPEGVHATGTPGGGVVFHVITTHGNFAAIEPGDWVVTEPDGNGHYPVKDEIFRAGHDMEPLP